MAMHVLVVCATKHGSTAEIAETIGAALREAGQEVDVRAAREVPRPAWAREIGGSLDGGAVRGGRQGAGQSGPQRPRERRGSRGGAASAGEPRPRRAVRDTIDRGTYHVPLVRPDQGGQGGFGRR